MTIERREFTDRTTGRTRTRRTYTAEFTENGRQHHVSLRTRNKNEAIGKVHKLLEDLRDGKRGDRTRPAQLEQLRDEYLELLRNRGRSPKTLVKYEKVLGDFVVLCTGRGVLLAARFEKRDFWAYRVWGDERGLAPKAIYGHLIVIKQLFKWAARAGRIPENPIGNVSVDGPPPVKQPCFTPDQVHALINAADEPVKPMIEMLAYTGMRVGELRELRDLRDLRDLRWDDVHLGKNGDGFIHIHRGGSAKTTKTKRDRRIPIHPNLEPVLRALPRRFERVLTRPPSARYPDGDAPINERWLLNSVKRLCRRCGFDNPGQFKSHTFRHAFCSGVARRGVPDRVTMAFLGQRSSAIVDLPPNVVSRLHATPTRQSLTASLNPVKYVGGHVRA